MVDTEVTDEVTQEEKRELLTGKVHKQRPRVRWRMIYVIEIILGLVMFWAIDRVVESFWK